MQSNLSAWRVMIDRPTLLSRLSAKLGRSGAVAIITAIALPALVMIVGFACDYGYASYINQRLARATDSGTLGSVSQTAATTAGGYTQTSAMQAIGVSIFNANIADLPSTGVNFNLSVVSDGSGGVVATGSYTYNSPTFFGGILGFNNIALSGTARTTARPLVYVNYYILVDASQSMGIASTQAGMNSLYNAVSAANGGTNGSKGCVFGCHALQSGQSITNLQVARNNNIELRIDAAVAAIKSIIASAQSVASVTKNIQFAIYTIQANPSDNTKIHTVASLSSDYSSLQISASSIDLGPNTSAGVGDTDLPNELSTFNNQLTSSGITTNGSGASSTSPLNFVFLVTDGVADVAGSCTSGHCTGPLNASNCTQLQSKSTVGVIYTTYSPIWDKNNPSAGVPQTDYKNLVMPFTNQIQPSLQNCATSTDYFFPANDGPDIVAAMQSLFQRTQPSSARITQ